MKRILSFCIALSAFASMDAIIVYDKSPASEMIAIKKQSNVDENIVLAYKTAKSREEADNATIMAFRENSTIYPQVLGIPDGKELLAEPERVATVLRFENKAAGTYDTFIYAYWNDLCKTPAEIAEIMSHSDWTETAIFKVKESEKNSIAEAQDVTTTAKVEPAKVVEEAPAKIAQVVEEKPVETAPIVEEKAVETVVTEQVTTAAPESVAVAEPAVTAEPKATEPIVATTAKTAFDKLVDDLTDAGLSESLTKLSNAVKLRKIRGFGAYNNCTNPKASYIVAANSDGHYVVLGPEKADGTRKNLSTGAASEYLKNYTPRLWFRR